MEQYFSLKNLIQTLGRSDFSLLIHMILNRVPILIIGQDESLVDELVSKLVSLAPHRSELIYYSDFVDEYDYKTLLQEENDDFKSPRIIIRSPSNASQHAIENISSLKGWILGYTNKNGMKDQIFKDFLTKEEPCVVIFLNQLDKIRIDVFGIKVNDLDLSLEKRILTKAIKQTEVALEKMKRVLHKKIKMKKESEVLKAVMNFSMEEEEIQKNIFQEEIQSFVHAASRALAVLSRIDLVHELGMQIKIADNTLLRTIDYEDVNIKRLLDFIKSEFGVDFFSCIKGSWKDRSGDKIDGLWG
ncbi:MAG: hypothetical protein ACTSSI_00120 [Candidatus Helarchaeota archaeon]